MKGTQSYKDEDASLDSFWSLFNRSVPVSLFGRADNEIAENNEKEISQEKNAQSDEDGDNLLVEVHGCPHGLN